MKETLRLLIEHFKKEGIEFNEEQLIKNYQHWEESLSEFEESLRRSGRITAEDLQTYIGPID
jgi:hypothetical protein